MKITWSQFCARCGAEIFIKVPADFSPDAFLAFTLITCGDCGKKLELDVNYIHIIGDDIGAGCKLSIPGW